MRERYSYRCLLSSKVSIWGNARMVAAIRIFISHVISLINVSTSHCRKEPLLAESRSFVFPLNGLDVWNDVCENPSESKPASPSSNTGSCTSKACWKDRINGTACLASESCVRIGLGLFQQASNVHRCLLSGLVTAMSRVRIPSEACNECRR